MVLPRPAPSLPALRCSSVTCRAGAAGRGATTPPRTVAGVDDAPLALPRREVERRRQLRRVVDEELGHVEADAAGADDRHPLAQPVARRRITST